MLNEPENSPLDEPGKPLIVKLRNKDGSESTHEVPQMKRDNCASAAAEAGGLDEVTDAHLARWGLARDHYNEFRVNETKARKELELHRQFEGLMVRDLSRPANREAYIEALKRLIPDDWQKHLPPD